MEKKRLHDLLTSFFRDLRANPWHKVAVVTGEVNTTGLEWVYLSEAKRDIGLIVRDGDRHCTREKKADKRDLRPKYETKKMRKGRNIFFFLAPIFIRYVAAEKSFVRGYSIFCALVDFSSSTLVVVGSEDNFNDLSSKLIEKEEKIIDPFSRVKMTVSRATNSLPLY